MKYMIRTICLLITTLMTWGVMADHFTYNIQMSGYKFEQYDEKGTTDYSNFLKEFRAFPWSTQVGKSNGGSESTISVKNLSNQTDLWVSVMGESSDYLFLVGIVYKKEVTGFLGLGKTKTIRWLEIYVAETDYIVESTFSMFFKGDHTQLMSELIKLPKYDEMEAKN